jgi:hypothetical protein
MVFVSVRGRALFAVMGIFAFSGFAAAKEVVSCRSFAEAAADQWADGRIAKADNSTSAQADEIVLISAGRKFIVPRDALRKDEVTLQPLGQLASDRQTVYDEELRRCLHTRELNIYVNR